MEKFVGGLVRSEVRDYGWLENVGVMGWGFMEGNFMREFGDMGLLSWKG